MPVSAQARSRWPLLIAGLVLCAGTLWLRAPGLGFRLWNVDEAIHAAVARVLLDGGVLYRDAVDIRNPLTYYATAGVFAVFGENNLWAVRCGIAVLVAATGWLLLVAGRALHGPVAGVAAAALYVLLATGILYQGDANAANTEWFVAFFSSAAAAVFLAGGPAPASRPLFATGLLMGGAYLAKQPALLDVAAPLAALLWAGGRTARPAGFVLRSLLVVVAGWMTPVLLTTVFFALHGALRDAAFYTWIYNLAYYGPEITTADRLASLATPFKLIGASQPLLLGLWAAGALVLLRRLRPHPAARAEAADPGFLFLTVWSLTSLVGAASSGRGFDHYTIQFLAPFCLGAGLALARLAVWAGTGAVRRPVRAGAALLLAIVAYQAGAAALAARARTLPEDPAVRVAGFIQKHSLPAERIFVWGFHPDIYLYADRRPASRYVIASFITGMIPWTNTAPGRDTAYAIVPGSMDNLLRDLAATAPAFIVDCSAGPNRSWNKYPLEKFPRLLAFINEHYLPVESGQFLPQGFRLFVIMDSFRLVPPAVPVVAAGPARAGSAGIFAAHVFAGPARRVNASAMDPAGRLQRLEFRLDGTLLESVSTPPGPGLSVDFSLPDGLTAGVHRVEARAVCADGVVFTSAGQEIDTRNAGLPAAELRAFALPVAGASLIPTEGSAPFGASAGLEGGRMVFFAHAPSRLAYALPDAVRSVSGGFGFRPGAYGPENKGPTDGARFSVDLVIAGGRRVNLLQRLLQPGTVPADRGTMPFRVELPPGPGRRLEFVIDPGPAGNVSSDWTYWTALTLENYR